MTWNHQIFQIAWTHHLNDLAYSHTKYNVESYSSWQLPQKPVEIVVSDGF